MSSARLVCYIIMLFLSVHELEAQCSGFPATIADADCSGGGSLSNNMNANSGTYGYCGSSSSSASYTGINLNGATLRICGNATLGFGSWNSGSLVVSCGATVTINSNVTLNTGCGIVNYGTLIINGSLTFQNNNNFVYNELASSKMTVTGNINFPSNSSSNGYLKNAGYIKVNGNYNAYAGVRTCFMDGGQMECANLVYMDRNSNCNGVAGNRFTFGSSSGSCVLRYTASATLYSVFTNTNRWNVYQAVGSTQTIDPSCNSNPTGWGSAVVLPAAPLLTVPSGVQYCSTSTCLTLPVELLKFFALTNKDVVVLSWATASETNCDYFSVERSSDALNWEQIATVPGSGTSVQRNDYSYIDKTPGKGINYYRLLQHDYNGKNQYFQAVYADHKQEVRFTSAVFPNPTATNKVTLDVSDLGESPISIEIMNALGQLVSTTVITAQEYDQSGSRYELALPENGELFFITILQQNNVLARHKVYVMKD